MTMDQQEWRNVSDRLNSRGRHLLETGLWSDCEVLVGVDEARTSFRLHRTILAMASAVFAAEFFEGQDHEPLTDVDPVVFRQLLQYIYTDECRVESVEEACSLAELAYRFKIQLPIRVCVAFLSANIRVENACKIMETANFIKDSDLSNKAIRFICKETKKVLNHESFLDVEVNTVSFIYKQMMLNIDSELDLIDAVLRYSAVHPTSLSNDDSELSRPSLRDAICNIHFLKLTLHEFSKISKHLTMLTDKESLLIIQKLASPDQEVEMPEGFSVMTIDRIKMPNYDIDRLEPEVTINIIDEKYVEKLSYEKIIADLKNEIIEKNKECEQTIIKLETIRSTMETDNVNYENDKLKLQKYIVDLQEEHKAINSDKKALETDKLNLQKTLDNLQKEQSSMKASIDLLGTELNEKIAKFKADIDVLTKNTPVFETKNSKKNKKNDSRLLLRCTRSIGAVKLYHYDKGKYSSIYFKLSAAATLVGLQLPTQVMENGKQYEERLKIIIRKDYREIVSTFTTQRQVPYNSLSDVILEKPVDIQQNEDYGIGVRLLTPGLYPAADSPAGQTDSAGLLAVTWLDGDGLVRGLLFEK